MQEQRIDTAKIEQLRRRRIARKRRTAALVIIAVALAAAYFTGIYGASLSVLADIVDTIAITIDQGTGWPQTHSVLQLKTADSIGGGAVLLGDSDMVMYSPTGKLLRSVQHGYGYPAISTGNTRLCLYNRSGKELRIESRSRTLNTVITQQPILLAKMAAGGSFAVVTESTRYAAELTVYNSLFNPVFSWYSAEDTPLAVALNANGTDVAAACIRPQNGGINSFLYIFKTGKDTPVAVIESQDTMPLMAEFLSDGNLLVIYDSYAAVYSTKDGAETARYSYGGRTLQTAEIQGKAAALIFGNKAMENLTQLVLLDENLAELSQVNVDRIVQDIKLSKTNVFVVLPQSVISYNFEGTMLGETQSGDKMLTVLNSKKLLMVTDNELAEFTVPKLIDKK